MRALGLAFVALASCASTPSRAITLTAPTTVAPIVAPLPASSACVLALQSFSPATPLRLLTRTGQPFANVTSADETVLSIEDAPTLTVTTRGVRLVGAARAGLMPIRTLKAHTFRGVLTPGGDTPLAWAPATRGVAISPEADTRLVWVGGPPSDVVACNDVALESSFDASDHPEQADTAVLRREAVGLSATAGGAPVLALYGGATVLVLERRASAIHVIWNVPNGALDGARVEGWIDPSAIELDHIGYGDMYPGMQLSGYEASSEWSGCDEDHPLFVAIRGEAERVGDVLAGTRVVVGGAAPRGLVDVELIGPSGRRHPSELELLHGVSFAMSRADADACQ